MQSNLSESPPEPVAAVLSSGDDPPPAVGYATRPSRVSYVPPPLRSPPLSVSGVSEESQALKAGARIIKTGHVPKSSGSSYDTYDPQREARQQPFDSYKPHRDARQQQQPSVLGPRPTAAPQAGLSIRARPQLHLQTDHSVTSVVRRDGNAANENSQRSSRNSSMDRRGRKDREADPFLKDEESEAMFCRENTGINFDAYEDIPVETSGENVPPPVNTFGEIDLGPALNANIERCKYVKPTPVQRHAIPISLAGRDLMACAQTGSGKTAAFCFPIIAGLIHYPPPHNRPRGGRKAFPLALILSPTRELSCQIHDEAKKFAFQTGIRVVVAYGGAPVHHQLRELEKGVDILVATPGRLSDLLERARLSLSMVRYLALDEADRMLDMGFEPQIRRIVEQMDMPSVGERQTMLFSATFPKEIQRLAADFLYNYIFLAVGRVGSSTDLIVQKVEYVIDGDKRNLLVDLIHSQSGSGFHSQHPLTLVFVETKRGADALEDWLCHMGFPATTIHGDRTQLERERALRSFRTGMTPILVATDVAARGLDIPDVAHVVNFDLPNDIDDYVHRIGRTGRAGKTGLATAFFTEKDLPLARPLAELMQESNQEVPDWLVSYAAKASYGGRGRSRRSGSGSRFGGRDYRKDSNRGGGNRPGGAYGGRGGGYGGSGAYGGSYGGSDGYGGGYGGSGGGYGGSRDSGWGYGGSGNSGWGYGGSDGYSGGRGGSGGYGGGYGGSDGYSGGRGGSGGYVGGYGGSGGHDGEHGGDYRGSGGSYGNPSGYGATSYPWV